MNGLVFLGLVFVLWGLYPRRHTTRVPPATTAQSTAVSVVTTRPLAILRTIRDHREIARCLEDRILDEHGEPLGSTEAEEKDEDCLHVGDRNGDYRGMVVNGKMYSMVSNRTVGRYGEGVILHPIEDFPLFLYRGDAEQAAAAALLILRQHEDHLDHVPALMGEDAWNGVRTQSIR